MSKNKYKDYDDDWSEGPRVKTSKPGKKHNRGNEYENYHNAVTPKKEIRKPKKEWHSHAETNVDDD